MIRTLDVALLPGDGIGPDVIAEAVKVLRAAEPHMDGVRFAFTEYSVGAGEFLKSGDPLPEDTFEAIRKHEVILLGAMGLPGVRWPNGNEMVPQIDLRDKLDTYFGLRPIHLYHPLDSPLRNPGAIDFAIVRENCEGLFASRKQTFDLEGPEVRDTLLITRVGSERLFRRSFKLAEQRRKKVTLIDKANVLPSMSYFRSIFYGIAKEFPDVETEHVYVDAVTLYLLSRPASYDVLVTENMFGDILSDMAAGLIGGMGMAPSGDIGDKHAIFQPSHGSAPDIAGKGIANPTATILSAAMMLDWYESPQTSKAARLIYSAVEKVFADRANRGPDLGGSMKTWELGDKIAELVARG